MILNNINQSERQFTNPTDIIGKIDNPALTVFALLFIMVASLSTNFIANYIPSQRIILEKKAYALKNQANIIANKTEIIEIVKKKNISFFYGWKSIFLDKDIKQILKD